VVGPSFLAPTLEIVEGGRQRYRVTLDGARYIVGRDPGCAVPLLSDYVSWHHATIERRRDAYWVTHEGSRNGLLLNGRSLAGSAPLRDGDELRVADVRLLFRQAANAGPGGTKAYDVETDGITPLVAEPASRRGPVTASAPLAVDERSRRLLIRGRPAAVSLSPHEFTLLRILCERPGEVRWRDDIGATIWGVNAYDTNQIHALVARVKKKLQPLGVASAIVAVPGVGYRLG
jgi:pSer/pThr/pTyr-binding forkhead associated (FHA) protein